MIDPAQIPDEVVEAMRESITDTVMFINEKEARTCIAAALAAWPDSILMPRELILPLPKETA